MKPDRGLREHLRRVLPEIVRGGVPMTYQQVLRVIEGARHVVTANTDGLWVPRAHAELRVNPVSPHRWTVSCAVEREYQGKGLGRKVLSDALAWADAHGAEYVDGVAWAHNEAVLRLDLSLGFEIVGRVDDAYRTPSGERFDQVFLVRRRPT
jgi:GNAT superfamily N-acetyltransferase